MKKEKNKITWRKLDNSAKLFPSISNKKFSAVFRLSSILNEKIDKHTLEIAVKQALEKFTSYKVKLRKGLFWYYLEQNQKKPLIEQEHNYPCKYIDKNTNNNYLFKVTYFENKINLDVFHALTDGNSATRFFKEIIYNYIETAHKAEFETNRRNKETTTTNDTEDSYLKNYDKHIGKREKANKAYIIKGKKLPLCATGVLHGYIDLIQLKKICEEKDITVTGYLTSVIIKAIYEENYKKHRRKTPNKSLHTSQPKKILRLYNSKQLFLVYHTRKQTHNRRNVRL